MKLGRVVCMTLMAAAMALPATLAQGGGIAARSQTGPRGRATGPSGGTAPTRTIEDLKTAYTGETTARQKYVAYARQADREGYKEVAVLFRAAAEAERIHAWNHKTALAKLGVIDPQAGSYTQTPGTTRENLADAIRGETYEKDAMYPEMIRHAEAEKQTDAARSMTFALDAERQHAALYTAALQDLGQKRAMTVFFVCPTCGATFKAAAPMACPTCGTNGEKFKLIR